MPLAMEPPARAAAAFRVAVLRVGVRGPRLRGAAAPAVRRAALCVPIIYEPGVAGGGAPPYKMQPYLGRLVAAGAPRRCSTGWSAPALPPLEPGLATSAGGRSSVRAL